MVNRYVHSTIFGTFVFNEQFKVLEKVMFSNSEQYNKREEIEKKLEKTHNATTKFDETIQSKILEHFRNSNYFKSFYMSNLELSKQEMRKAGSDDILILQTISSIVGMDKTTNLLTKRLRDWYAWYNPEFNYNMDDNEKFVELITLGEDRKDTRFPPPGASGSGRLRTRGIQAEAVLPENRQAAAGDRSGGAGRGLLRLPGVRHDRLVRR